MEVLLAVHATCRLLWPVRPGSHLLAGRYVAYGVPENVRFPQGLSAYGVLECCDL